MGRNFINICYRNMYNHVHRAIDRIKIFLSYWKISKDLYDFDYSSVLAVEKHQLQRLYNSINKYRNHVDYERDLNKIKLAIKLLDIYMEEVPLQDYDSVEWKCIVYVNTKNLSRFFPVGIVSNPELIKIHLYQEKAWYLYHKVKERYMRSWWD